MLRASLAVAAVLLAALALVAFLVADSAREPDGGRGVNEIAAIAHLRGLAVAQDLYREGYNQARTFAPSLRVLGEVRKKDGETGLVDAALASGTKQGYLFTILHADGAGWSAAAEPRSPGVSGIRSFFVDESGRVRYATTGRATSLDRRIGE